MRDEVLEKIRNLNKKYEANDSNGLMIGDYNFLIIEGRIPILLSAPHAVRSVRDRIIKPSDIYTGSIVEYLCLKLNTFGIIRSCNMGDDPNYDMNGYGLAYKKAICYLVERYGIICLIDIHGCGDLYSFDIDIGINNSKNINYYDSLLYLIYKTLSEIGKVTIDAKFKASNMTNISRYVHEVTKVSCYQLEISKELRTKKTKLLLETLEKMILEYLRVYNAIARERKGKERHLFKA